MKEVLLGSALIAIVAITGCKKEEAVSTPASTSSSVPFTRETVFGSYKIVSVTATANGNAAMDASVNLHDESPCHADDVITFNEDMTYAVVDAGVQCSPATGYSGTWNIAGSTGFEKDGITHTIKSWDGRVLLLNQLVGSNGAATTFEFMYVKQP